MGFSQQTNSASGDGADRSTPPSHPASGYNPAPARLDPEASEFNPASLGSSLTAQGLNTASLDSNRPSLDHNQAFVSSNRASFGFRPTALEFTPTASNSSRASLDYNRSSLGSNPTPGLNPSFLGSNRPSLGYNHTSLSSNRATHAAPGSNGASLGSNPTLGFNPAFPGSNLTPGFNPTFPSSNRATPTAPGSNHASRRSRFPAPAFNRTALQVARGSFDSNPTPGSNHPTYVGFNGATLDANGAPLHLSDTGLQFISTHGINIPRYANKYSGSNWKPEFHALVRDGLSYTFEPAKFPGHAQIGFRANGHGIPVPTLQFHKFENGESTGIADMVNYPYFDTSIVMYDHHGEALYRPEYHTHFPLNHPEDYRQRGPRVPSRNPNLFLSGIGSYFLGGAHVPAPASDHVELDGDEWIMNNHPFIPLMNPAGGEQQLPVLDRDVAVRQWLATSDQFEFEKRMEDPQTPPRRSGPSHHSDDSSSEGSGFQWA